MPRQSMRARASRASVVSEDEPGGNSLDIFRIVDRPASLLRTQICGIFGDAQKSSIGHRKSAIQLRKLHESSIHEPSTGEADFSAEFARCVVRLLDVKRTEAVADRVVAFVGVFLEASSDSGYSKCANEDDVSHLVNFLLDLLLPLFTCKDKTVRYRACQVVAHTVNSVPAIDDAPFVRLQKGFIKRLRDKEPQVRIQAATGLLRIMSPDEKDDDVLPKLLQMLQTDPSAEVRRFLLSKLPLSPTTVPYLVERARDLDPATRRILYSRVLPELADFRHLSLTVRDKLLRWGFKDRDEQVQKATARLFRERWIADCARSQSSSDGPNVEALLELLERIDILNAGAEDGMGKDAMREFWQGRPDYVGSLELDDAFWDALTPESIFMARTLNDHYRSQQSKFEAQIDQNIPELTRLALILQQHVHALVKALREKGSLDNRHEDDETVDREFVIEQLLHIGKTLDFGDEMGRRSMFGFLREILAIPELPEETTRLSVHILRQICASEGEFCGIVFEAIAEVHDVIEDPVEEESFHSARSQASDSTPRGKSREEEDKQAMREIVVNMKCLHIAQCMLQNVYGALQQNSNLMTMLNNLIVPAVRSHEAPIRERGLLCLGLFCLLDRGLAEENVSLFVHCFNKGHEDLQVTALHVLADLVTTHPTLLEDEEMKSTVQKSLSKAMSLHERPLAQTAAIVGLCRLMLLGAFDDSKMLKEAVLCYLDPASGQNPGTRQALSYFFPVYCFSRGIKMAKVAVEVLESAQEMAEDMEEDEEMVSLTAIGAMLADWTDPRRVQAAAKVESVNGDSHLVLAGEILARCLRAGEERKALFSMLGKLHLVIGRSETPTLRDITALLKGTIEEHAPNEAAARTALKKAFAAACKALGDTEDLTLRTEALSLAEPAEASRLEPEEETEISEAETEDPE